MRATTAPGIAILGAGRVGSALAQVTVDARYEVSVAASGDPERIDLIARIVMPGATPRWAADAVAEADLVVLAIPLHAFASFDASLVDGKVVVNPMNYWAPIDGVQALFEDPGLSSSEIVQRRLTGSATTTSASTACATDASSSPAVRCSARSCAGTNSNGPSTAPRVGIDYSRSGPTRRAPGDRAVVGTQPLGPAAFIRRQPPRREQGGEHDLWRTRG